MRYRDTGRLARALLASLAILTTTCGNDTARPGAPADPDLPIAPRGGADEGVGLPDDGDTSSFGCRLPNPGCACDSEADEPVECHSDSAVEDEHGRLRCLVGHRACEDGAWGACVFTSEYRIPRPGERAFGDPPAACGNCDPSCFEIEDDYAADPGALPGTGILWDGPSGGIIISGSGGGPVGFPFAYIGLESTSQVAKIDTTNGQQVGRFILGIAGSGASSDPSRTAVDSAGDVYVGMRARAQPDWHGFDGSGDWASVAKIGGEIANCFDFNGNTTIETSVDDVPLPAGTDECVLWDVAVNTAAGGHLRGLVVDRGDVTHPNGYPWVAGQQNPDGADDEPGVIYQLDPDDGTVLQQISLPIHVYGSVVDGGTPQRIWLTSRNTARLVAVVLDAVPYLEGPFAPPLPGCTGDPMDAAYGISIDSAGRIWRGGWSGCPVDYITSYTPSTNTWCLVSPGFSSAGISVRVNDDGTNTVYSANPASPGRMISFDPAVACVATNTNATYCNAWPDNPATNDRFERDHGCSGSVTEVRSLNLYPVGSITVTALPAGNDNSHGLGIAMDGRVWIQNRNTDNIYVWDPETAMASTYPSSGAFGQPYSYSDFTGYSRSTFTLAGTSEYYREYGVDAPACAAASSPVWGDLTWTATTTNSHIDFFAQAATDPALLDAAARIPLGSAPVDASPIFVNDLLPPNLRFAQYIRIIAALESDDGTTSPILQSLGLDWSCQESE